MNDQKKKDNSTLWIAVLISAGVALFISAVVSLAFQLPSLLARRLQPAPDLAGFTLKDAENDRYVSRFVILTVSSEPSEYDEGVIIRQTPEPGERIRAGDIIQVVVSSGKPETTVPVLSGLDLVHATEMLQAAGLFIADVVSKHDTMPEDFIVGSDPAAGATVEKGSKITIFMSLGPLEAEVPKVTGRKLASAKTILEENGFAVGEIRYQVTTEYYQGTVMKQEPKAGEMAPRGSQINLIVAGVLR